MGRARGSNAEMAMAFEATYGTTPASGFIQMPFVSSGVGASRGLIPDDLLGLGRDPQAPTLDVVEVAGDVTVPMDVANLGHWLRMIFGDASTTGSGPYTHTFTSGATDALPSVSLEHAWPEVPYYEMLEGVKASSLSFEMTRGAGTLLTAQVGLIGKGYTGDTSTNAGTPSEAAVERFSHFQGGVSRNDSAMADVTRLTFNYSNGLDPLQVIATDGEIGAIDEGMASCTGEITVRFGATTLIDQAVAGTAMDLDLSWTYASGKSLAIAVPRVFLERPGIPVQGPAGIDVTYSWTAAQQSNGNPMVTATLINSTAAYA